MSIIKLNNRSVKDVTTFGSASLGSLTHIATQTASSSASLSFTSGIDSTYKEYIFYLVDIHPATDGAEFDFNFSTDGGSNYNVTKTTTFFRTYHNESDTTTSLEYVTGYDLAQSTAFQTIMRDMGSDNDQAGCGSLHFFNPSSTTFVKHFISDCQHYQLNDFSMRDITAGYGNTTSAIDAVQFKMSSGNIDAGTIKLYGLKDS